MITVRVDKASRCNGEWALYVSFPYDINIVNAIREFPTKYWNAQDKEWELPVDKLGTLTEKLPQESFEISGHYQSMEKKVVAVPKDFQFKTKPFEHQQAGFQYGLNNDKWLLGDEQGLGKTKQVIDIAVARKLLNKYKHCLIICGVNGLKWNWMNEVHTHSNEQAHILGMQANGRIGSNRDKLADVLALDTRSEYFIITNIESLRDETIAGALSKACTDGIIGMIAFDECHKAKNPTSEQGKGVLKLNADTMIAMTGTPLMNQPFDLFIILKWLGCEKHAFYSFKKHYGVFGGYGGYQVIGYQHLDELQESLDKVMLRRLKDDVLDLPEKTYIDEYVEMTAKQAQIYREVTSEIRSHIDEIKMINNPLTELIRTRQATGYTGILSSTIKESAKLDRMEELVDEAVENNRKVVIFSNWTQMTTPIYERLSKKYRCAVITGEIKDAERQRAVDAFQNDPKCRVIIGTIGAMGTGLTLTAGTVEIFVDEPWNRALYDQCVDRCHRVGTTQKVTIYNLMCKDTIDERIHEIVQKKGIMADALVDGQITGTDKLELLNYLLG